MAPPFAAEPVVQPSIMMLCLQFSTVVAVVGMAAAPMASEIDGDVGILSVVVSPTK